MNRRNFTHSLGAAFAAPLITKRLSAQSVPTKAQESMSKMHSSVPHGPPQQIAMLLFPKLTALDLFGPHTFMAGLMNVNVHLVWKTKDLVSSDKNVAIQPTTTLADCPKNLDILFVPGGMGAAAMMEDSEVIEFLADRGARARYVTSVCTGSLILGAAGLLQGYKATSHWAARDLLPLLGAEPVEERVVVDRNRITGAGVTSGIDFGLVLTAKMRDDRFARMQQLACEYDPQPPFHAGTPEEAGPELTGHLRKMLAPIHEHRRQVALKAQARWKA